MIIKNVKAAKWEIRKISQISDAFKRNFDVLGYRSRSYGKMCQGNGSVKSKHKATSREDLILQNARIQDVLHL